MYRRIRKRVGRMEKDRKKIPDELKGVPHWVRWERTAGGRKIPRQADGRVASVTDPDTWGTFEEVSTGGYAGGVGFVLTGSPYMGIDIDDCMDGGRMERKALAIVERFGSYAELSPSGRGVHIVGRGRAVFPSAGSQDGRRLSGVMGFRSFEVYNEKRFLTMTGRTLGRCRGVVDVQDVLDRMTAALWGRQDMEQGAADHSEQARYTDAHLLKAICASSRREHFMMLYERGDTSRYKSQSEADFALLSELAFWTGGNARQMGRLFSASALGQREKWRARADYRAKTIQAALTHWNGKSYSSHSTMKHGQG